MLGGEIDPEYQGGNRAAHLNRGRVTVLDLPRFGGLLSVTVVSCEGGDEVYSNPMQVGPPRSQTPQGQCCTSILQVKNPTPLRC